MHVAFPLCFGNTYVFRLCFGVQIVFLPELEHLNLSMNQLSSLHDVQQVFGLGLRDATPYISTPPCISLYLLFTLLSYSRSVGFLS